jgi:Kelch motif
VNDSHDERSGTRSLRVSRRAALGGIGGAMAAVVAPAVTRVAWSDGGLPPPPTDLGPPVTPIARQGHTATPLKDHLLLVVGGYDSSPLSNVQIYDPKSDSWFAAAPLNTARHGHAAVAVKDGIVVVLGGMFTQPLASVEVYSLKQDLWLPIDPLDVARFDHAAAMVDDHIVLVTGGFNRSPLSSVEFYQLPDIK